MNMKKTLLSSAIVAALGSPMMVQAINLSTDGVGEALMYPYYSTMNGNQTFITVANTTNDAKAVKVRFREGVGSRDVMDFTLYLSANDYWVAVVSRDGDAVRVSTDDTSCTVPDVGAATPRFSDTRISDDYTGDTVANRLSEGHIEIIEMAALDDNDAVDASGDGIDDIEEAITHASGLGGAPPGCDLARAWTAGVATNAFGDGSSIAVTDGAVLSTTVDSDSIDQAMLTPTGGLYGHAAVFNPADGIYYTYQASALRGYAVVGPLWFPQNDSGLAALAPYTTDDGLAFDEGEPGSGLVEYFDLPDLSTPAAVAGAGALTFTGSQFVNGTSVGTVSSTFTGSFDANAEGDSIGSDGAAAKRDAVTFALMRAGLRNDYVTGTNFETEWVVTFPTRYLHVDFDDDNDSTPSTSNEPFTEEEDLVTGEACETVNFTFWDREENTSVTPGDISFSPGGDAPDEFQLCFEVNVMAFNQSAGSDTGSLKSSSIARFVGLADGFDNGWASLDFTDFSLTTGSTTAEGLPVLGFAAVVNDAVVPRGGTFGHHLMDLSTP